MSDNILYEVRILLLCFLTGVWLMAVYDVIRVIRLVFAHHPLWTGLEDLIYWVYASLVTFHLLYRQNNGRIRWYVIAGVFAGMTLYHWLVSRFFLKLLKKVLKCLKIKISALFHRHET